MRTTHLSHQLVDFIPEQIQDGILYVSLRFGTAVHKCFCGCGEEVVTPLGPADWSISIEGGSVTLHPSIGNWSYPCRSHYLIRRSKIVWAGELSDDEIEHGREVGRLARQAQIEKVNRAKARQPVMPSNQDTGQPTRLSLLERIRLTVKKWFGR